MSTCGVLFPNDRPVDPYDHHGCIKPYAHNDAHIFKTEEGTYIEWEDDYKCDCGCWKEWENGGGRVCIIYSEIDYKEISTNK